MSWVLTHLYEATKNPEHLRNAMAIWLKSIDSAREQDMVSRVAELYWNIARAHDVLEEYLEASENFKLASENYTKAAEKIPQLKDFYHEYASYMQAWSEFEKAKQLHAEKKYLQAKSHYENTARILESTTKWNYIAPNHLAWARLEEAEDFSRKDMTSKAIELFQEAIFLFEKAKREIDYKLEIIQAAERENVDLIQRLAELPKEDIGSIEIKKGRFQSEEEKELLITLAKTTELRRNYCLARITLEEAITLDQQGDKLASSRRFGSAAELFEGIIKKSQEMYKEIQPLVCLCRAWQNMTQAEAEALPEKYVEASQLFEKIKDQCTDEKSKRLIQGHSHFCKALEISMRFEDDRDPELYSEAVKHLESASNFYIKAESKGASEYAKGTQRLLDAYFYMDKASKEADPQKKERFFLMAERLLESSMSSYALAKYQEKSKEVERLLGRVKEERSMASSLSELLHASTVVSKTDTFIAPMPTSERAVGLERFENADIQANLILGDSEVKVGEAIRLEIELTNAGKGSAQLLRVEDLVPKGFTVKSVSEICKIRDSHLNMKGRTLQPLKTEEIKIVLNPVEKGTFHLKPKILYIDEAGRFKSHEPEPVSITVKELGISGWLKGPRRKT